MLDGSLGSGDDDLEELVRQATGRRRDALSAGAVGSRTANALSAPAAAEGVVLEPPLAPPASVAERVQRDFDMSSKKSATPIRHAMLTNHETCEFTAVAMGSSASDTSGSIYGEISLGGAAVDGPAGPGGAGMRAGAKSLAALDIQRQPQTSSRFTVLFVACRRRPPRSAAVGERSDRRGVRYELSGGGFLWERSQ